MEYGPFMQQDFLGVLGLRKLGVQPLQIQPFVSLSNSQSSEIPGRIIYREFLKK
jgi:hypothetical protein